jgi:hypothetical protein
MLLTSITIGILSAILVSIFSFGASDTNEEFNALFEAKNNKHKSN